MIRTTLFSALLATAALPAFAEETSVAAPIEAASLHEGPLDMVAYYARTETGAYEVTATFADRELEKQMRVVMALEDGDAVQFSMPLYPEARYGFARDGEALTVSAERLDVQSASLAAQTAQDDL